jgi:hypothetical protein
MARLHRRFKHDIDYGHNLYHCDAGNASRSHLYILVPGFGHVELSTSRSVKLNSRYAMRGARSLPVTTHGEVSWLVSCSLLSLSRPAETLLMHPSLAHLLHFKALPMRVRCRVVSLVRAAQPLRVIRQTSEGCALGFLLQPVSGYWRYGIDSRVI